jgi:hypothetical protein
MRILNELSSGEAGAPDGSHLCEVCAEVVVMSGAGIMLMSGDVPRGSVGSSNEVSALIEELQYVLGEGPCVDAYRTDRPVVEADLAAHGPARWPAFTSRAVNAGALAVFGFPLQVGAVRLGALNLYRDRTGALDDDQHADALVMAGVAARAVLDMQAQAPPGGLAAEMEAGSNFRFVVHQAAGMLRGELGISVAEALVRLRAYAFANDLMLDEVAEDVVTRRLKLN